MQLYEVDAQTLSVIIQTQLDDIRELARTNDPKGKGHEGGVEANLDVVLEMYRAELSATAQSLGDQVMCRSIANAVRQDAGAIRAAMALEEQSARDRNMAIMLSGNLPIRTMPAHKAAMAFIPTPELDDNMLEKLGGQSVLAADGDADLYSDGGQSAAGPSSWGAGRGSQGEEVDESWRTCGACTAKYRVHDVAKAPCNHEFCGGCLKDMFTLSLTDETLFPPQCCRQPIPMERCRYLLSAQLRGQFAAKKLEYETPNRTYCCQPKCSAFVPPSHIKGDIAACVKCRTKTCTICKSAAHVDIDCPRDPSIEATVRLAAENSWRRCPTCQRMVELRSGCYHISRATSHRSTRPRDTNQDSIVSYDLASPIQPCLLVEDILRTRYCIPGSIFLIEAIEPCIAVDNQYRTVQVLLGDSKLCIQALLRPEIHCFIDNGHIFEGCYVRVDTFELRSVDINRDDVEDDETGNPSATRPGKPLKRGARKMAYLLVSDMVAVGWNRTYLDILGVQHPPNAKPTWSSAGADGGLGLGGRDGTTKPGRLTIAQLSAMDPKPALNATRLAESAPLPVEPARSIPASPPQIKHDAPSKAPQPDNGPDYISDSDSAVESPEVPTEPRAIERPVDLPSPRREPAIIRQQAAQRANIPKPSPPTASVAPPACAPVQVKPKPKKIPWKVTDLRQGPFVLRTLVEVNTVKMLQNWMMNVLAVIASVHDIGPVKHQGYMRRTVRLADPSTTREVLLAVYLDPEAFAPRVGSVVMITGVKNHTEDGGSLRKWPSDRLADGKPWWTDDPGVLGWCRKEVEEITRWWEEEGRWRVGSEG